MKRKYIVLDLGSFHTRIEGGFDEPSIVAIDNDSKYVAAGKQAEDLFAEAKADSIKLLFPIRCGEVCDYNAASYMLKTMLNQQGLMKYWWSKRYNVICQLHEVSAEIEIRGLVETLKDARFRNIKLVFKSIAIAQCCELDNDYFGRGFKHDSDKAIGVLDLGRDETLFSVVKSQEIKTSNYQHNAIELDSDNQITQLSLENLAQFVKEHIKKEYEADLRTNGIILSGGHSAQIQDIQKLGATLGFPVYCSKNPSLDTINGLKLIRDRMEKGDGAEKCFLEYSY